MLTPATLPLSPAAVLVLGPHSIEVARPFTGKSNIEPEPTAVATPG